ncbi:MAG: xylose isomerase [Thermococcus sp.]|nr:xylose isomerase [Thermococcus sp.]
MFDWGTYNAISTLAKAATLGMRLTEIPPAAFNKREEDYFKNYAYVAKEAFTTITAHAPSYGLINQPKIQEKIILSLKRDIQRASLAQAEVFNIHIGRKFYNDDRDLEIVADIIKELLTVTPEKMYITVETAYTPKDVGSLEEIKAIAEMVNCERVIPALQLENVFVYRTKAYESGRFEKANKEVDKNFWMEVLSETLELSHGFLSLRFSQIIGFYIGNTFVKKRVPLYKGYPDIDLLAEALAEFMVKEVKEKELPLRMHLIYTGPSDTKYEDTVMLYSEIMIRASRYL